MRRGDREYERRENIEWEVLLARVLDLLPAEQLRIHQALSDCLGGQLGQETERARQARARLEALETMRAAAERLGLPDGQAPTIPEFKQAAKETKLPMTFSAVYRAFDDNWEIAARFYRGESTPPTAAAKAVRRAIGGRNSTSTEAPITCVRLFLAQESPPVSTERADYSEWARERNESLPSDALRVVERADHIRSVCRASWSRCLAVARNEMTLEEAQEQTLGDYLSETGLLVGHHLASWVLGRSPHARHAERPGYPAPVVCLGGTNWLWLLSDIKAYGNGKRDFTHAKGSAQHAYLDTTETAALLEISFKALQGLVSTAQGRNDWSRVPAPAGKAGKWLYWERPIVERWQARHPEAVGSKPGGRPWNRSTAGHIRDEEVLPSP